MAQTRTPLSRERILQAALVLVDERGLEALTMRELGRQLGFEAMSLYNHVANKDDVIDGMLDLVLAESEAPARAGDWTSEIRASAISVHDALHRHLWAVNVLFSPGRVHPARLRYMESLLAALREGGLSAEATYTAYHVLDAHIFGFSLWAASHTMSEAEAANIKETAERVLAGEEYPYLREHAEQHFADGPYKNVSAFELGLDLILDGLKKLHPTA